MRFRAAALLRGFYIGAEWIVFGYHDPNPPKIREPQNRPYPSHPKNPRTREAMESLTRKGDVPRAAHKVLRVKFFNGVF